MEKEILECIVTGIKAYGIFVVCGEYDGLLHISEISDEFVTDPFEYAEIGMKIKVAVLSVDEKSKNLKLSYKQIHQIHPRIQKRYRIKKGFITLERELPKWLEKENE